MRACVCVYDRRFYCRTKNIIILRTIEWNNSVLYDRSFRLVKRSVMMECNVDASASFTFVEDPVENTHGRNKGQSKYRYRSFDAFVTLVVVRKRDDLVDSANLQFGGQN